MLILLLILNQFQQELVVVVLFHHRGEWVSAVAVVLVKRHTASKLRDVGDIRIDAYTRKVQSVERESKEEWNGYCDTTYTPNRQCFIEKNGAGIATTTYTPNRQGFIEKNGAGGPYHLPRESSRFY